MSKKQATRQQQIDTLRLFWRAGLYAKKYTIIAIAATIVGTALTGYVTPIIISKLFDYLQSGTLTASVAMTIIITYFVVQLIGKVVSTRLTIYARIYGRTVMNKHLYEEITAKLNGHSARFHAEHPGGMLISQAQKLVGSNNLFWNSTIFNALPIVTSVITANVILWVLFWQFGIVLTLFSVVILYSIYRSNQSLVPLYQETSTKHSAISGQLSDNITNIMTVKAFSGEDIEAKRINRNVRSWSTVSRKTARKIISNFSHYATLLVCMQSTGVAFVVFGIMNNSISGAVAFIAITYTLALGNSLQSTNMLIQTYNSLMGDANDMVEIIQSPLDVKNTSTQKLQVDSGAIAISNIAFTYKDKSNTTVFKDFSLAIAPGEKVGLVGASGSGKSTLAKLLLRFSDAERGTITIDQQDIASVSQSSLRRAITYVPQEPLLFHRSLRENIAYGKHNATEKEIIAAAKKANAWEFIKNLKGGLDTKVGERGVKLSGGQRQRIAIARAVLKDAPIVILDEATSALDSESEKLIQQSLHGLMQKKTAMVIAHRLSTLRDMDRILVLDDGKIVEDGTHEELLAQDGHYTKLWQHQSGGFV